MQARPNTRHARSTTSGTTSRSVSTTGFSTCVPVRGRLAENFQPDKLIHRDEESVTDGESLRHCIEFIRYTPHHFGQGIILYNGEGFWENWYFTVADGIRVGDDLARFHFQNCATSLSIIPMAFLLTTPHTAVIHRPVFGVHGSFLMTNGEMENECTWCVLFFPPSKVQVANARPVKQGLWIPRRRFRVFARRMAPRIYLRSHPRHRA